MQTLFCSLAGDREAATELLAALADVNIVFAGGTPRATVVLLSGTCSCRDPAAARCTERPVIVLAPDTLPMEQEWSLLDGGAVDVLRVSEPAVTAAAIRARLDRVLAVQDLLESLLESGRIVGASRALRSSLRRVIEVAHFGTAAVLVTGASGTGKEIAARLVHELDPQRSAGPFVVLDCGTMAPELAGSELFGHVRGAYTGAVAEREGALAQADGGTLFLDELGELAPPLQAQLLRALEDGSFKPVGGVKWRRSDFRLVCATNRSLPDEVAAGRFRLDLYHRVHGADVRMPALAERREDILPLARHFLRAAGGPALTGAVEAYLVARAYPGNVRELKALVDRLIMNHQGSGPITAGCVPRDERPARSDVWPDAAFEQSVGLALATGITMKAVSRAAEATCFALALQRAEGSSRRAAELLGISERAVQLRRAAP